MLCLPKKLLACVFHCTPGYQNVKGLSEQVCVLDAHQCVQSVRGYSQASD